MYLETEGFYIVFHGDPSVGIFPAEWTLEGDFIFSDEEEYDGFVEKLEEAYEYVSPDPVSIESFEERKERIKKQRGIWGVSGSFGGDIKFQ